MTPITLDVNSRSLSNFENVHNTSLPRLRPKMSCIGPRKCKKMQRSHDESINVPADMTGSYDLFKVSLLKYELREDSMGR